MPETQIQRLLDALQERAKELNCLYEVDEILLDPDRPLSVAGRELVDALPAGWQYPDIAAARMRVLDLALETANYRDSEWSLVESIEVEGEQIGDVTVSYLDERPIADEGPFLREERRLIAAIARRIGFFVTRQDLRRAHDTLETARASTVERERVEWDIILDFLRRTNTELLRRLTRRMINHLGLLGVTDADYLLQKFAAEDDLAVATGENRPIRRAEIGDLAALSEETFGLAAKYLGEERMVSAIRAWIDEEQSSFVIEILEDQSRTLADIADAIGRHHGQVGGTSQLAAPARRFLGSALLRRLFTDDLEYIGIARRYVELEDVYDLVNHIVYPAHGHGKLGGKASGLFLAQQILRDEAGSTPDLEHIRVPRAWYVSSDGLSEFLKYNNLKELYFRRYMEIEHVRQEYPRVVQVLKNSYFPPEISRGLALVLDDFSDRPLVVRSSSLLEDRMGSSFAGKYKSLFIANRGSRQERLAALQDAIAEIYASVFGPDPIEYRAERGLLDVHEEMGILIQEVVGTQVGRYFLPAFAGVAFSNNEFRWSPRIRRDDGLVRVVPGLGTRAVDRLVDDYPILASPGQPGLRVNVTRDEFVRYSPHWMDVVDLDARALVTVKVQDLLRESSHLYPQIRDIVSIVEPDRLRKPVGLEPDFDHHDVAVTFDGLMSGSPFLKRIGAILDLLSDRLERPVDVEFASDGVDLYVLQCRAQSYSRDSAPAIIPRRIPTDALLFRARRNISNGDVPDVTHVVYVDPDGYSKLESARHMRDVGNAVGKLNRLLPRRQFVLIGPGRWGSRGDIKLGVPVSYADISNCAVLMEVARKKGDYVPELSFGTHFFQDLVEADIRYIPIYPEEPGSLLDEGFLRSAGNLLPELVPEFAGLGSTLRVVDISAERNGNVLRILMNADSEEAVGMFDRPDHA